MNHTLSFNLVLGPSKESSTSSNTSSDTSDFETDASSVIFDKSLEDKVIEEGKKFLSDLQPRSRPKPGLLRDDDSEDALPKRSEYDSYVYKKNLTPLEAAPKAKPSVKYNTSEWSQIMKEEPVLLTADGSASFIAPEKKRSKYAMYEHSESDDEVEKKRRRLRIRKRKDVVVKTTGKYDKPKRRKRPEKNEGEVDEAKKSAITLVHLRLLQLPALPRRLQLSKD